MMMMMMMSPTRGGGGSHAASTRVVCAHVPIAHVRAPRGAVRYYAVYGLGLVRVAEASMDADDDEGGKRAMAYGSVFVASVLRDDERESIIASRARMKEAVMRGEMERVRGMREAEAARARDGDETPTPAMTLPRRFGNVETSCSETTMESKVKCTPPRLRPQGSNASSSATSRSRSSAGTIQSTPTPTPTALTFSPSSVQKSTPKQSFARIRRNMKRRLERLDVELDALRAYLVDGEFVVGSTKTLEDAREALRLAQWRRCEHDLGIARLEGGTLPSGLLESLLVQRSPSVFSRAKCETGGLTSCAFTIDGLHRIFDTNATTPQSPDDVEDGGKDAHATIVPYDFMRETCACDACLKTFARAMFARTCVCPSCLDWFSRANHKNTSGDGGDSKKDGETAVVRTLIFDEGDEARVKQWDAIAKHAATIARVRLRKRLDALIRALAAPPTLCLPWIN